MMVTVIYIPFSVFWLPHIYISIIGSFSYFVFLVFWYLFFQTYKDSFNINDFCKYIIILGTVMAFFGLYQRFIDQSLFGIMTLHNSYFQESTLHMAEVFRISSFCPSTQMFSMFIGICSILLLNMWNNISLFFEQKVVFFLFMLSAGFMAGGKVYPLLLISYVLFWFGKSLLKNELFIINFKYRISRKNGMACFLLLGVFIFLLIDKYNVIMPVMYSSVRRIFLFLFDSSQAIQDENIRIAIMSKMFSYDFFTIFFGHGLGTSSTAAYSLLSNSIPFERFTTESWILSIGYEMGVIGFISYLGLFFVSAYKYSRASLRVSCWILALVLSLFCSPAFYGYTMFPFYGVIIYAFYITNPKEICEKN